MTAIFAETTIFAETGSPEPAAREGRDGKVGKTSLFSIRPWYGAVLSTRRPHRGGLYASVALYEPHWLQRMRRP